MPLRPERRSRRCFVIPSRYLMASMCAAGVLLTVGVRATFALILTHVTAKNDTDSARDLVFSDCRAMNSTLDEMTDFGGDSMFMLHSAYFVGYFLTAFPGGVLCTLVSPVKLVGLMSLSQSAITLLLPSVIISNRPLIFVLRVAQGLLEGSQQPISIALLSAWCTQQDKASLTGILFAGVYLAPSVAFLLTSTCICYISWSSIFYIYGAAGIVWSAVFLTQFYDTPQQHPSLPESERQYHCQHGDTVRNSSLAVLRSLPWRQMLKSPPVWASCLGSFSRNLIFSAMMVEQPQYFLDSFKMNTADIGLLVMVPYLSLGASCLMGGVMSDHLENCGLSRTRTRKLVYTSGALVEGSCLVALYFADQWSTAFLLLCVGVALGGVSTAGYVPMAADMAPQYAGVITGLAQLGSSGAIISTVLASAMTGTSQSLGAWQNLFLLDGCIHLGCMLIFDVFADARRQTWATGAHLEPVPESDLRDRHPGQYGSRSYESLPYNGDLTMTSQIDEKTMLLK